jgi:hypothetical protein
MLRRKPDRAREIIVDAFMPSETGKSMKTLAGWLVVVSAIALVGCKQEPAAGVYVEISLKNDTDIDKYVVFNPNIKTVEECEATFAASLPTVMANLPQAIPKNSTATGWKCSVKDPSKKK